MNVSRRVVVATCAVALVVGSSFVSVRLLSGPRIMVDGHPAPSDARAREAWLRALAARRAEETWVVGAERAWTPARLRELGVAPDVAATERLLRAARPSPWERLRGAPAVVEVPLSFRAETRALEARLSVVARELRREPVGARLDLARHTRVPDVPGRELDMESTVARVLAAAARRETRVDVAMRPVRAATTMDDLGSVDVSKVLSSFETTFANTGIGVGRAANIANAAKKLDGTVLAPGTTFSFNEVVGERSLAAGFTYAPEIVGDELETGVGGGTCQVATTLHAAALFGALDVVERRAHGRAAAYAKVGLDATVAYGKVDLRLRNPFPFPVILHATLPTPTLVRVEIIGGEPQASVKYGYAVHKSEDFFRRITFKPSLGPGAVVRHQKGARGQAIISFVTTTFPDGRATRRVYSSEYRPVPEVLWVGPGVDDAALPEVPEGATRIERRGLPEATPSEPSEPQAGAGSS
jgi:vancomycin resistance protein YoaR